MKTRHFFKSHEYAIFIEDEEHSMGSVGDFTIVDVLEDQELSSLYFKGQVLKSSDSYPIGRIEYFYSPVFRSIDFNCINFYTQGQKIKLLELYIIPFGRLYL